MGKERINLGRSGEKIAAKFLKRNSYVILERNFSSPFGEIDIIAKDKDAIVFIEVRTKRTDEYGLPVESIRRAKIKRLVRIAWFYIKGRNLEDSIFRFDVASILIGKEGGKPEVTLIKDAFGEDQGGRYYVS